MPRAQRAFSERGVLLRHPEEKTLARARTRDHRRGGAPGLQAVDPSARTLRRLARHRAVGTGVGVDGDHQRRRGRRTASRAPPAAPSALPLVPPLGVLRHGHADAATVEAWLARAPAAEWRGRSRGQGPSPRSAATASSYLATPEWRALTGSGRRPLRGGGPRDASPVRPCWPPPPTSRSSSRTLPAPRRTRRRSRRPCSGARVGSHCAVADDGITDEGRVHEAVCASWRPRS